MRVFIVGGGRKIHFLAKSIISKGHELTIIEKDHELCVKLSREHKAMVIQGDGTRPYVLRDSGISTCDLILALTPKDPDNLLICQLASSAYGINKTLALVNDPANISVFKKLGVSTVLSTVDIISSLIEQKLFMDDIMNLLPIEDGKVSLMEVELKSEHPVVGLSVQEASFPADSIVGCILRQTEAIIPKGNTILMAGDRLVILSLPASQSEVLKLIQGRLS